MHSVLLNIPFTGLTVEVTSDQGLRGAQSNRFRYLPPRTCPPALHLRGNPSQLKIELSTLSGAQANERGLPDVVVVAFTNPAHNDVRGARDGFNRARRG
jgi:hypothetical protein